MRVLRVRRGAAGGSGGRAAAACAAAGAAAAGFDALEALDADAETGRVYGVAAAVGGHRQVVCYDAHEGSGGQKGWRALASAAAVGDFAPEGAAAAFACFSAEHGACGALLAGLRSGELLVAHASATGAAGGAPLECVGAFSDGLAAGALSPDGDALALLTRGGSLLTMDAATLELRDETAVLEAPDAAAGRLIGEAALSWRGDGRFLAAAWALEGKTGEAPHGGATHGATFEREGLAVHSVLGVGEGEGGAVAGEPPLAAPGSLAWQPSGALVAMAVIDGGGGERLALACFERNGLLRHKFTLPTRVAAVERLSWSADSSLLAATVALAGESPLATRAVQVYRRSNGHWYQLWERQFVPGDCPRVTWDAERAEVAHLWTAEGAYERLSLGFEHAVSQQGTAAVIDGARALLTPLAHARVPPPACLLVARAPEAVGALATVVWSPPQPGSGAERLAAAFACGRLGVASPPLAPQIDAWEDADDAGGIRFEVSEAGVLGPFTVEQLTWAGGGGEGGDGSACSVDLVCLVSPNDGGNDAIVRVSGASICDLHVETLLECPGEVPIDAIASRDGALAVAAGGKVRMWRLGALGGGGGGSMAWDAAEEQHDCDGACALLALASATAGLAAVAPVTLSVSGVLRASGAIVARGVTSAALRCACDVSSGGDGLARLVFVIGQDAMGIGVLAGDVRGLAGPLAMRPAEAGARVVAAPAMTPTVVLQMPRGNLELVAPRALTAPRAAALLRAGQWGAAYALMRHARVDLNLLLAVKGAEPPFLAGGAALLVAQLVESPDGVAAAAAAASEIVTALREDWAMAAGCYADVLGDEALLRTLDVADASEGAQAATGNTTAGSRVVTAACSALCEALDATAGGAGGVHETAALVTLVRSRPPRLEAALRRVRQLRMDELAVGGGGAARATSASSAMKALLKQCSALRLDAYGAALGSYDLDLALFVASEDGRDPAEYLERLHELAAMPLEPLRRAAIDEELGRHEAALDNLVSAGADHAERATRYALDHSLFAAGLRLLRGEGCRAILTAYGDAASGKGDHKEAALAYARAGDHTAAAAAHRAAGQWSQSLAAAARGGSAPPQLAAAARALVEELREGGDAAAAAELAAQWLIGADELVCELLCAAGEWRRAAAVAARTGRLHDLGPTVITPAAAAAAVALLELTRASAESRTTYLSRLAALKAKRDAAAARQAEAEAEAEVEGGERWDAASEASTVAMSGVTGLSRLSAYTTASHVSTATSVSSHRSTIVRSNPNHPRGEGGGQKRRGGKKERKARAGSPHEEAALVRHLRAAAPSPDDCRRWRELLELLACEGHGADAARLQRALAAHTIAAQEAAATALAGLPDAQRAEVAKEVPPALEWRLLGLE